MRKKINNSSCIHNYSFMIINTYKQFRNWNYKFSNHNCNNNNNSIEKKTIPMKKKRFIKFIIIEAKL